MSSSPDDRAGKFEMITIAVGLLAGAGWFLWRSRHGDPSAINGAICFGIEGAIVLVGLLVAVLI